MNSNCEVLIVGGGPTGLMMACQLLRSKISFRIIDELADRAHESRALVIHAKSMEIFKNLDLESEFLAATKKSVGLSILVNGNEKAHLDFGNIAAKDTPFPSVYFLAQSETERLMIEHLAKSQVQVERQTELLSFTQDAQGVRAQIKNRVTGQTEEVTAQYIVGADGSHSRVRHILDLPFDGAPYRRNFLLADLKVDWSFDTDRLMIFLNDNGLMVHFPLTGNTSRLIFSTPNSLDPKNDQDPTLEQIQELAKHFTSIPLQLSNPVWLARFHLHHRSVKEYRKGRAFLAGDAAHIHSPAGGQGMNTGLQDAANLAWKLILVLRGQAAPELLDTYQTERHRIGEILLKTTDRIFGFATLDNIWLARLRNLVLPGFLKLMLSQETLRKRLFRYVSQLGVRYHKSSFFWDDLTDADELFRTGPTVGRRAPDAPVGSKTLFDLLKGPQLQILLFSSVDDVDVTSLKERSGDILKFHDFRKGPGHEQLFERYGISSRGIYVVRPDGYVAFRSAGGSGLGLTKYLAKLLLAQ